MSEHRFQDYVRSTSATPALAGSWGLPAGCSFVPCPMYATMSFVPCPMYATMTAVQQGVIQAVYQRAAELVAAEAAAFAPAPTNRLPAFSIN